MALLLYLRRSVNGVPSCKLYFLSKNISEIFWSQNIFINTSLDEALKKVKYQIRLIWHEKVVQMSGIHMAWES